MSLVSELKRDEAFRSHPYDDATGKPLPADVVKGKLTIGYGINIAPDGPGLTEEEATAVLEIRAGKVAAQVSSRLPWTAKLDDVRHLVLCNMAYNMGIDGLMHFQHFLAAVEQGDWPGACAHMQNSLWFTQVGARARRLVEQMRSGIEQ